MSSIEASPTYYNPEDWQCKATSHSYENTKFEIDLIATFLDRLSLQDSTHKRSRHFIAQPGVCSTSISKALIGPVLDLIKLFFFYVVRDMYSFSHITEDSPGALLRFSSSHYCALQSCYFGCAHYSCAPGLPHIPGWQSAGPNWLSDRLRG